MTVLVVDDNATNRRILADILASWGMRPTVVESGHAAIDALQRAREDGQAFPLALIDFQMPDLDGFELAERIQATPELGTPLIMMLSSAGQRGDAARCKELGVASYLTKPVRRGVLLEAVLEILATRDHPIAEAPVVTRHSIGETQSSLRILVAEDNAVNRRVVCAILEKRGHTLTVAENGHEAVAAALRGDVDLMLMDVQMPEMDGLEATAAIRQAEQGTGRHLPIVGLTAHAMKETARRAWRPGWTPTSRSRFSRPSCLTPSMSWSGGTSEACSVDGGCLRPRRAARSRRGRRSAGCGAGRAVPGSVCADARRGTAERRVERCGCFAAECACPQRIGQRNGRAGCGRDRAGA